MLPRAPFCGAPAENPHLWWILGPLVRGKTPGGIIKPASGAARPGTCRLHVRAFKSFRGESLATRRMIFAKFQPLDTKRAAPGATGGHGFFFRN
jgi:hypothetical protein